MVASSACTGRQLRILLVEDSEDILFLMRSVLEKMGYTVTTAVNGEQGLEAAQASAPDLIISDIRMPLMDGYELIRCVREAPRLSGIPAIALTGFQAKTDMERALEAGFDACVSKPAEAVEIDALIRRLTAGIARLHPGLAGPPAQGGDN